MTGAESLFSVMRRWAGSRQDVSSFIVPASIVNAIASEVATLSENEVQRRIDRTYGTQPALRLFVGGVCEPLSPSIHLKADLAVSSMVEMFEEHRGRRLPEIDRRLI